MKDYGKFYIGGEWVESDAPRRELIDPATGQAYATIAMGTVADVDRAVLAARSALRRRFVVEFAGTVAVVAAFYLLWRMSPSQVGIEPLPGAPALAANMILLLWLAAQFKPAPTAR
jgi:hypothetical protein